MLEGNSMHTILDDSARKFSISYIDANEAIFMLGLLRPVSCTHCPDFYKGCKGGLTMQENAMINEREYLYKHISGTEEFLCGKLRNIVCLSTAEEQDLSNNFEGHFNRKVSFLAKKNDENQFVLVNDRDEFASIMKNMERQILERVQKDVERINQHNALIVAKMQEKIISQENIIKTMQDQVESHE